MRCLFTYLFLVLSILTYSTCYGQESPLTTKEIIKGIAKNNYVAPYPDGLIHFETPQFKLYELLKETASTKELLKYTEDRRSVVRVYAIKCLDDRKHDKLFEIAKKHINDNKKVRAEYHISLDVYVGDFFVSIQNISKNQRGQLDSLILYKDNKLSYLNTLLSEIEPNDKHYERIKYLANDNEFGSIALAKYKKKEDLDFLATQILKNSYYRIKAIEIFPDESFKNTLLKLRAEGYNYYGTELAVAAFKDTFSVEYFKNSLNSDYENEYLKKQRSKYIFQAISKYKDSIYTQLFFKLWSDDFMLNSEIFNYLITIDPKTCIELSKQTLVFPEKFDNSSLILTTMIDYLIINDSSSAAVIIRKNIEKSKVSQLSYFVEKAVFFKNQEIINAMFSRLNNTSNGHIYIPIVNTILSYKDAMLNEKLINNINENIEINGWGLQTVKEALKRNGLTLKNN